MLCMHHLYQYIYIYYYSPVILNSILSHLLDKYAPSKTISVTLHHDTPCHGAHGLLPTLYP